MRRLFLCPNMQKNTPQISLRGDIIQVLVLILTSWNVGGVQVLVCLVSAGLLEELVIEHIHNRALVRHSQLHIAVSIVQCLSSDSLEVNEVSYAVALNRLTAAVDAAAGTSHDLNELVILSPLMMPSMIALALARPEATATFTVTPPTV